jgi:two-component system sensor histidine kinase UhpB
MNGHTPGPDEIRDQVRAEERERLSLELHDSVGQTLALAKLQLTRIQDALRRPLDADMRLWIQGMLASLIPEMDTALHMVRTASFTLHAAGLTEAGLVATLENECVHFTHRTGIPCEGRFESLALDAESGKLVLFIFREALCNIAQHSSATKAQATLQRCGERAVLVIRDNGIGMDSAHMRASGIGVHGMEARARALGGELTIQSTPHEGTEIRLSFSLPQSPPPKTISLHD